MYSFEQAVLEMPSAMAAVFRKHTVAWRWFESSALSYRKAATWWVVSAKRQDTREKRLHALITCSGDGVGLPQMRPAK